ncbi:MAG: Holliday junction branch migration DNA helicase RuvB [Pseudomonadota bacterium]
MRINDPNLQSDDQIARSLRPQTLDAFIGQEDVCRNLNIFIQAAKNRAEAIDHILFYGPPGLGKTTLSQIVAQELGVGFRATSGPVIARAGDLAALLSALQPQDVMFIDEIHRLNPAVEEILYPALEDFKLDIIIGEGPGARSVRIDIAPFTLIAATTRPGMITTPLRERFGIPLHLNFYGYEDLTRIVLRAAKLLKLEISKESAYEIAKRSRGTPRVANRLLRRIRDFANANGEDTVNLKTTQHALKQLDIDAMGLDKIDNRYLEILAKNYRGGPTGIDTLAAALSSERDVLEEVVEPFLLQIGLIDRTTRGRRLTHMAWQHLGLNPPNEDTQSNLFR